MDTKKTYDQELLEEFELLNSLIQKEKDPKKRKRLETFKSFCIAKKIIPEAASYEDFWDWYGEENMPFDQILTPREFDGFQQDIDDSRPPEGIYAL